MEKKDNPTLNTPEVSATGIEDEADKRDHISKKMWRFSKQNYEKLCEQIEFYFSPSNLAKDRFMSKLIQDDQYIPLSVFMSFNRIKNILNGGSENIIRKALIRSTILELSEDQTKVRRKEPAPVKSQEETDECSLYVEQIPINTTHESLKVIFSRFGKVNYVSLPRYKKSRHIKQFGFIEFDEKESVEKAINCFKMVDGVLQYSSLKAENLLSIVTHDKEAPPEVDESSDKNKSDEPPEKKLKLETEEIVEVKVADVEEKKDSKDVNEITKTAEEIKDSCDDDESAAETSEKPTDDETKKGKKKNRKHKKKSGQKSFFDERAMALKVMPKKEWKKMRNAYLNLERQKAKEIKKILRESYNKRNNNKIQKNQKFSPANTASPRINFYGSPNDREDPIAAAFEPNSEENPSTGLTFIPGVIVNIKFREPCVDFKELKREFKQYSYVTYVDVLECGAQCFIRVESPNSAHDLISQYSSCEYEAEILKDEAEKEYWKKIFEKRDQKKNKDNTKKHEPVKRRRGREKLMDKVNKVAQHIRFEENEEGAE
ncbi:CLUMA_CG014372, isoform A [Clunio marinus]|uniref:CLUMA_CG014372, isoform A n=1 Tax=Clunio marinus TaxID=568069 RepID=A0A1J1INH8_9DIPT|nr:CLUMA_CG014372, isoform A [Clunio marinus]